MKRCAVSVVVKIGRRNAIPVRAIWFLTDQIVLSPIDLAKSLGQKREAGGVDGLSSYRREGLFTVRMKPRAWGVIEDSLQDYWQHLQFKNAAPRDWEIQSVELLPAGVFVWKNEFDLCFKASFAGDDANATWISGDLNADLSIDYAPMMDPVLEAIVMEGFKAPESDSPTLIPMETKEQRQERRLAECEAAELVMPRSSRGRLPDGVGALAEEQGISRQAFSSDVKGALKRREDRRREGR